MSSCNLLNLGKLQVPFFYIDKAGLPGPQGDAGTNGRTILSGSVNPTTQGDNGDFYINTSTSTLFGPKASGTWPPGVSLIGQPGVSVLNTSYSPFTSGIVGAWVPAKIFTLPGSYIANERDAIEIEVQGAVLGYTGVFGGFRAGKIQFKWGSDAALQTPIILGNSVDVIFVFKAILYRRSSGMFFNYSVTVSSKMFNPTLTSLAGFLDTGEFSLTDPTVNQSLSIELFNNNLLLGPQVRVNSFVIKAYNAI